MKKLTMEEHDARATLLGRWYDPSDNTYNRKEVRFGAADMIDADTLEPVTTFESHSRKIREKHGCKS